MLTGCRIALHPSEQSGDPVDPLQTEQGAGWAQVAPMILARQREVADHVAAQAATVPVADAARARTDRVREPERGAPSGDAATADARRRDGAAPRDEGQRLLQDGGVSGAQKTDARGLTEAEQKMVRDLKARDAEVRRHEQAHAAVGGQYAGSPTYTYQTGPDGQQYAIGGAVSIDVSPVEGDPDATINKMDVVKAAALAPAEPSSADRQVAALADVQRAQAVADLAAVRSAEREGVVDRRI